MIETLEPRRVLDSTAVFNEIMYNPPGDTDDSQEWIELYNQLSTDVDLSDWSIEGGIEFDFPGGETGLPGGTVLPGHGYLVLAKSPESLDSLPQGVQVLGPYTGQLSNGGEELRLINNDGRVMNVVDYDDDGAWPVGPDGAGLSLAKRNANSNSEAAENWTYSGQLGGSPGEANFSASFFEPLGTSTIFTIDADWTYDDSGADQGTAWRESEFDDSGWDAGPLLTPPIMLTEAGTASPDYFEVQNLSNNEIDTSGWIVVSNNARDFDVNAVHDPLWSFPGTMAPGQIVYRADSQDDNIFWRSKGNGWMMILDDAGTVVDAVIWGYPPQEVADMQINVAPFGDIRIADSWNGDAVVWGDGPSASVQRIGDADHDNASDWTSDVDPTPDAQNEEIITPFATVGTEMDPGHTTYYYRHEFDFQGVLDKTELLLNTIVDDGAVFYLNGVEVYRLNMPSGEIAYDTLAADEVGDASFTMGIKLPTFALRQGTNVLAVEVHQAAPGETDVRFGAELFARAWPADWENPNIRVALNEALVTGSDAYWVELANFGNAPIQLAGYTIRSGAGDEYVLPEQVLGTQQFMIVDQDQFAIDIASGEKLMLLAPGSNTIIDAIELDTTLRGRSPDGSGPWLYPETPSPAGPNQFALHDEIVINEIMYHHHPWTNDPAAPYLESDEEWIELFNRSTTDVDLSGWRIEDGIDYVFPLGTTIEAGGYLVVANDVLGLREKYPDPDINIVGNFLRGLANDDDRILLVDNIGNPADEVHYYESGRWPAYADGGGSSLELRNPDADNDKAEAWAASDETDDAQWTTYSFRAECDEPLDLGAFYNEFIFGLLDSGEFYIDDIHVVHNPQGTADEMLQNGDFEADALGESPAAWRLIGNHSGTVTLDPDDPGNQVLHVVAVGAQQHIHDHGETTFAGNTPVRDGDVYELSFRARWLGGSPQLNSRFYFTRMGNTMFMEVPLSNGTPGALNSTYEANIGPTYTDFGHFPILPASDEPLTVSVEVEDPDGVASMTLWWAADLIGQGGNEWKTAEMVLNTEGVYTAEILGMSAGTVVQFYVAGQDLLGATSTYPAAGPESRALFQVDDGRTVNRPIDTIRLVALAADNSTLFSAENRMSNNLMGATLIHNNQEVFYDVGARQVGSRWIRPNSGYKVTLNPDQKFYGVHSSIRIDMNGMREIYMKQMVNRAGGSSVSMYDDVVYWISPQHSVTVLLNLARHEDVFLEEQFQNGGDGTKWELDDITYPTAATPHPEGPKLDTGYSDQDVKYRGEDPEAYRGQLLIKNNRAKDDYQAMVTFARAINFTDPVELYEATNEAMDVDLWMRHYATQSYLGNWDTYGYQRPKNLRIYTRPEDGKLIPFFWDADLANLGGTTLIYHGPFSRLDEIRDLPGNLRLFYGHMWDMMNRSFNPDYIAPWLTHFSSLTGEGYAAELTLVTNRTNQARNYILGVMPQIPFSITTGDNVTVDESSITIEGEGWIDVRKIYLTGRIDPLQVVWVDDTHWQAEVPLAYGDNVLEFVAHDFEGNVIDSQTRTVNSTISERPLQDFLRITELNYNPPDPTQSEVLAGFTNNDDFEFIELTNIGGPFSLDLAGARFSDGVTFTFSADPFTPAAQVVITEVGTTSPDYIEIQNVSDTAVDTTGWVVAGNDAHYSNINDIHTPLWGLPEVMEAGELSVRADTDGDNIFWQSADDGWVIIVDEIGSVVDFFVWGYSPEVLADMNVTVGQFSGNPAQIAWSGEAAAPEGLGSAIMQRQGNVDHDNASDWTFDATGSLDQQNPALSTPFLGAADLFDPGEYVVLARNPAAFTERYGYVPNLVGPYTGGLSNGGEHLLLVDQQNALIHDFTYGDSDLAGWPNRADGTGATLEIINPFGDYNDPDNWRSSSEYLGTPGRQGSGPYQGVVVNEVLTHTPDSPLPPGEGQGEGLLVDAIELYNPTDTDVVLDGWWLSDSAGDFLKFQIPADTTIPAFGYVAFYEGHYEGQTFTVDQTNEFGGTGEKDFALSGARGDDVWLLAHFDGGSSLIFADHVEFGGALQGEALGRWPNGSGNLYPMTAFTPDGPNSGPRLPQQVVFSEVMYNPPGDDIPDHLEYLELYNFTAQPVDLTGWRLRKGFDYDFAPGTMLDAQEALVIVSFDPSDAVKLDDFRGAYGIGSEVTVLGNSADSLNDLGDLIQLQRPDAPPADDPLYVPHVIEDEVDYLSTWHATADGLGDSLNRTARTAWGNDASSWTAEPPTPGTAALQPEVTEVTGRHLFYDNSYYDNEAKGLTDLDAVATDKVALLPGELADFTNYTSYVRGINGIIIDISGLANPEAIDANDFTLKIGNDDMPANWADAPAPANIDVIAGSDGSSHIVLTWPDHAIQNTWLEVTLLATEDTGIEAADVFYFGNAIAETGDCPGVTAVDIIDVYMTRFNPQPFFDPATIDNVYDFNRDRRVNAIDTLIARNNQTWSATELTLLDLTQTKATPALAETLQDEALIQVAEEQASERIWNWLQDYQPESSDSPAPAKERTRAKALWDTTQ